MNPALLITVILILSCMPAKVIAGVASLMPGETTKLTKAYAADKQVKASVDSYIIKPADKVINGRIAPNPQIAIYTSGNELDNPKSKKNTNILKEDARGAYQLALAFVITKKGEYRDKAKEYILAWAKTYTTPSHDAVANTNIENLWRAYDLIRDEFSKEEAAAIDKWIGSITAAVMATNESKAPKPVAHPGLNTRLNNHRSHLLKIVALAGVITSNQTYINYTVTEFPHHLAVNFTEKDGSGIDFIARDSVRYHAYSLEEMLKIAILLERAGKLKNAFELKADNTNHNTLQLALAFLLPYANGERKHLDYANSLNVEADGSNRDHKRLGITEFDPAKYAVDSIELSAYFAPSVQSGGKDYDLLDLSRRLRKTGNYYPSLQTLINLVTSPYQKTR